VKVLLLYMVAMFAILTGYAQSKPQPLARVKGVVIDSARKFSMISSTVSLYRNTDEMLLKYTLTDAYGRFSFSDIQPNENLSIVISSVGYRSSRIKILWGTNMLLNDIGIIRLPPITTDLSEVVIKATPPVQIKGDTIEFHADAFQVEENAVVEDLLKKLPGVILWNDGLITINGKKVSSVTVNGKIFFSTEAKVALQNLPKNIVKTLQVIKDRPTDDNPNPTTVSLNVQLKEGHKSGIFGKLNAGRGSVKHDDNLANLNYFNEKTQIAIGLTDNDVNKTPLTIDQLLSDAVYSPASTSSWRPDFQMQGQNKANAAGGRYSYAPDDNHRAEANVFYSDVDNYTERKILSITTITDDILTRKAIYHSNSNNLSRNASTDYIYKSGPTTTKLILSASSIKKNNNEENLGNIISNKGGLLSEYLQNKQTELIENEYKLEFDIKSLSDYNRIIPKKSSYEINYQFIPQKIKEDRNNINVIDDIRFPSLSRHYNRNIKSYSTNLNNDLGFKYKNINRFLRFDVFNVDFTNHIEYANYHFSQQANDKNITGIQNNVQLTYNENFNKLIERPGIVISKNWKKYLDNRYFKNFDLTFVAEGQYVSIKNSSTLLLRAYENLFTNFIPKAAITYQHNEYGEFSRFISLRYNKIVMLPSLNDLVAQPDSSDITEIFQGNENLHTAKQNQIIAEFINSSSKGNLISRYSIKIVADDIQDYIGERMSFNSLGQTFVSKVNFNQLKRLSATLNYNRSFSQNGHRLTPSILMAVTLGKEPVSIESEQINNNIRNINFNLNLRYSYNNLFEVVLDHRIQHYHYTQKNIISATANHTSEVKWLIKPHKRFTIEGLIKYQNTSINNSSNIRVVLVNASGSYKFLKSEQLMVTVQGLDLLGQNKMLQNTYFLNNISQVQSNSIKRFYLISMSYFPRFFKTK
jgi:hypothetical protein